MSVDSPRSNGPLRRSPSLPASASASLTAPPARSNSLPQLHLMLDLPAFAPGDKAAAHRVLGPPSQNAYKTVAGHALPCADRSRWNHSRDLLKRRGAEMTQEALQQGFEAAKEQVLCVTGQRVPQTSVQQVTVRQMTKLTIDNIEALHASQPSRMQKVKAAAWAKTLAYSVDAM